MRRLLVWAPAVVLTAGAGATLGIDAQRSMPLRMPLEEAVSDSVLGRAGRDLELPPQEIRVAGVTTYLLRQYDAPDSASLPFSVYVGYYERQFQGTTIHSPKNCLPGSGWNALDARTVVLATPAGDVEVNRYLVQNDNARALVLYWYQGRGRIEHNEYRVKWDLLRDAVTRRRTDEALVRIVVPLARSADSAERIASEAAVVVVGAVARALPPPLSVAG